MSYMWVMSELDNQPPAAPGDKPKPKPEAGKDRPALPKEVGGPTGPEPTRYGDWERKGRVSDF